MTYIVICVLLIFSIFQINTKPSKLRIIGGRDADEDKYPYIVRLEKQYLIFEKVFPMLDLHLCTGAVVTPTWTLTAAHCILTENTTTLKPVTVRHVIRHGSLANNTLSEVMYTIVHPAYKLGIVHLRNDVGLMKTEEITLNQYARVSAIDFSTLVGQEVTLTGYGITNSSEGLVGDATMMGKPLQMLDVVIVQCTNENLDAMMPAVCLARQCGPSSGICPGDSGGPMLHQSGVVGVNSIGSKDLKKFCALKSTEPIHDIAVITPLSPYIDWISKTIEKDVLLPDLIRKKRRMEHIVSGSIRQLGRFLAVLNGQGAPDKVLKSIVTRG